MNAGALGTIGTKGLVGAIEAMGAMVRVANVSPVGYGEIGSGLAAVMARGDAGTVRAATDAGAISAVVAGEVVSTHVIPRPHTDAEKILPYPE